MKTDKNKTQGLCDSNSALGRFFILVAEKLQISEVQRKALNHPVDETIFGGRIRTKNNIKSKRNFKNNKKLGSPLAVNTGSGCGCEDGGT
jgi:hypothetical protein